MLISCLYAYAIINQFFNGIELRNNLKVCRLKPRFAKVENGVPDCNANLIEQGQFMVTKTRRNTA